ncbi:MAG: hypothetical protein LBU17_05410, partial [Treponema sp.]|nr:hypothetical protein [Treponema sp.]
QQPTANSQQPTANSQQPTANSQQNFIATTDFVKPFEGFFPFFTKIIFYLLRQISYIPWHTTYLLKPQQAGVLRRVLGKRQGGP